MTTSVFRSDRLPLNAGFGNGVDAEGDPHLLAEINLCLESIAPTVLVWGKDRKMIYNQAFADLAGSLPPDLFGAPLPKVWPEAWAVVGPGIERTFETGQSYPIPELPGSVPRDGILQECFLTYNITPIHADDGTVTAVFIPIVDNTSQVQHRRRLETLRALAAGGVEDGSVESLYTRLAETLSSDLEDVSFALLYLVEPSSNVATLRASTGLIDEAGSAPATMHVGDAPWPTHGVPGSDGLVLVDDVATRFPGMLAGHPAEPPQRALVSVVDFGNDRLPKAINILGVSNRQPPDADYQRYLYQVARQLEKDLRLVATTTLDREHNSNLQRAMQSNRQIGAAIGILMTTHRITNEQAFDVLSQTSQRTNRKLRDVADEVVLTGTVPRSAPRSPTRRTTPKTG